MALTMYTLMYSLIPHPTKELRDMLHVLNNVTKIITGLGIIFKNSIHLTAALKHLRF